MIESLRNDPHIYSLGFICVATLYSQLRNATVRRLGGLCMSISLQMKMIGQHIQSLEILGRSRPWILESFRVECTRYYERLNQYPRVAAWRNGREVTVEKIHRLGTRPSSFMIWVRHQILQTPMWVPDPGFIVGKTDAGSSLLVLLATSSHFPGVLMLVRWSKESSCIHMGRPICNSLLQDANYDVTDIVDERCGEEIMKTPNMQSLSYGNPNGWLGGEHMNSWMEFLIRSRPLNANWTVAYTSTISVHPENNQFIIMNDPHVIGTLDGSTRPYPSWNDVDWVFLPIHVAGNHWATGVIDLDHSHFYVFDSLASDENKDVISQLINCWTPLLNHILEDRGCLNKTRQPHNFECEDTRDCGYD
ncbi:phospholipase-like protein [Tanacetum coccineum]|uniref:Phospholipase-like protein n=1 Tax=Tanacetum coccineum TaxID=301880 RepID=A0ABQ5FQ46_9ASTR